MRATLSSAGKILLSLAVCASLGCGGSSSDGAAVADQAADGASTSASQSAMVAVTVTGAAGSTSSDVATAAATATVSAMSPAGCVAQTQAGLTVTYVFTNCTGPYGLASVNGSLAVTYGVAAGGTISASYSSTALKINKTNLELSGSATKTTSGAGNTLAFTSTATATGPRGHTVTLSGNSVVTWNTGSGCATSTGSWTTQVDLLEWTTTSTNYEVCGSACPAAGGSLSFTGPASSITLTFDGSAEASYSLGSGKTGTVALTCG